MPNRWTAIVLAALLGLIATAAATPATAPRWVTPAVTAPGVQQHTFRSAAVGAAVSFHLYLPAAYDAQPARRFPVLYWLHGTGGGERGIAPLAAYFDDAMKSGRMPPALVVFPHGLAAGMWIDAKSGRAPVETLVVRELIAHIDATWRTVAERRGRVLEGFSMGGYGAARWAFIYPEVFAAVTLYGAGPLDLDFAGPRARERPQERARILHEVFGDDLDHYRAQSPFTLAARAAARGPAGPALPRLRIVIGERDFTRAANESFAAHLSQLGLACRWHLVPGAGHDMPALLRGLGDAHLAWYRDLLAGVGP